MLVVPHIALHVHRTHEQLGFIALCLYTKRAQNRQDRNYWPKTKNIVSSNMQIILTHVFYFVPRRTRTSMPFGATTSRYVYQFHTWAFIKDTIMFSKIKQKARIHMPGPCKKDQATTPILSPGFVATERVPLLHLMNSVPWSGEYNSLSRVSKTHLTSNPLNILCNTPTLQAGVLSLTIITSNLLSIRLRPSSRPQTFESKVLYFIHV